MNETADKIKAHGDIETSFEKISKIQEAMKPLKLKIEAFKATGRGYFAAFLGLFSGAGFTLGGRLLPGTRALNIFCVKRRISHKGTLSP